MKSGIVVDNYKLEKFKERLERDGFDDFEVVPFTNESSTIQVNHEFNRILDLKKLCTELELHFKRRN